MASYPDENTVLNPVAIDPENVVNGIGVPVFGPSPIDWHNKTIKVHWPVNGSRYLFRDDRTFKIGDVIERGQILGRYCTLICTEPSCNGMVMGVIVEVGERINATN